MGARRWEREGGAVGLPMNGLGRRSIACDKTVWRVSSSERPHVLRTAKIFRRALRARPARCVRAGETRVRRAKKACRTYY